MLREFEEEIIRVLEAALVELPKGAMTLGATPSKLPGLAISNAGFEFESSGLAEEVEERQPGAAEKFSGTGTQTSFKLKEKPLPRSVKVQYPPGTLLVEGRDFSTDYRAGSVSFRVPPTREKNNILVEYLPRNAVTTLKGLKIKATYIIDVWGHSRTEADALAERVLKALLVAQADLAARGTDLKPIAGSIEEETKATKIRLRYALEREIRVEKAATLIEQVAILGKKID